MIDIFREIWITAARGKNNFTMDRGSFSYDQEISAEDIVKTTVKEGWEPHYAVIYGDCADSLEILGHMLGLEVYRF